MSEWWSYAPQDLLLFAPDTYWRLFALANQALWPLPVLAPLLFAAATGGVLSGQRALAAGGWLLAAAGWVLVAEAFLAARYQPLNPAVAFVRPAFLAQAALLAAAGALSARIVPRGARPGAGLVLAGAALAWPVAGLIAGRPLAEAEVVGIAPDPTAAGTLGLALLAARAPVATGLAAIPALWLLASAATLLTMGEVTGWLPLGAVAVAVLVPGAAALARRSRPPGS